MKKALLRPPKLFEQGPEEGHRSNPARPRRPPAPPASTEGRDVDRQADPHEEAGKGLGKVLAIGREQPQPLADRRGPPSHERQRERIDPTEVDDSNLAGEAG